jgi:hypothetical protein
MRLPAVTLVALPLLVHAPAARAELPRIDVARVFLEAGWRVGFGPDLVPYEEPSDEDIASSTGIFTTLETPWHLQAGGLAWVNRRLLFGSGRIDGFRPVRSGASPWVLTGVAGLGWTVEEWDEGGEHEHRTTSIEYYNKYTGQRCADPVGPDETYAHGCEKYSVTRRDTWVEPPGLVKGWYAAYAGWRHAIDVEVDDGRALGSAGGPVLGLAANLGKKTFLSTTLGVELGYYAIGDASGLGAVGRFGWGTSWLFMDFVGRLDGVLGNEVSVGLTLHLAYEP